MIPKDNQKVIESWVEDLKNNVVDQEDRMKGYALLFTNRAMMETLNKMLVEDTKAMMTKYCYKGDYFIGLCHGMFLRVEEIINKAKICYETQTREKPDINNAKRVKDE